MKKSYIYLFGIIVLAFLLYMPSLNNGYTNFDDDVGVTVNEAIRDFSLQGFKNTFSSFTLGMYMPLTMSCYTVIYHFAEYNPWAYHFFQLLLHLLNIWLVFKLVKKLNYADEVAIATAALFAFHPLHVESISWVAALSTPLFSSFFLLAILQWLDFQKLKSNKNYVAALLFMILACISKSAAVTLTPVLLLFDFFTHRNLKETKVWLEKIPFLIVSIFFGVLTFYSRNSGGNNISVDTEFNFFDRLLMVSHTILFYIKNITLPFNLSLLWYPFYKDGGSWSFDFYLAPIILLAIAYFLFFKSKNWFNLFFFGLCFYLFIIGLSLPIAKLGAMELRSDRYTYLPSVGILFTIVVFLLNNKVLETKKTIIYSIFGLFCLYFAYQTYERTMVWKNSITLFSDYISKYPKEPTPYFNRGLAYLADENYTKAQADFEKVSTLDSHYFGDEYRKGFCKMQMKQYKEAILDFEKAITENPEYANAFKGKGFCKLQIGDFNGSIIDYEKAKTLNNNDAEICYNLGLAYFGANNFEKAKENYGIAIKIKGNYPEALINQGNIFAMQGQVDAALGNYNKAITLTSSFPNVYLNRGRIFLEKKMYQQAIADFTKVISMTNDPRAFQLRGQAYLALGDIQKANFDLKR